MPSASTAMTSMILGRAFQNFKRGNELLKTAAEDYDQKERSSFH